MKKSTLLRILIPVLILVAIGALYLSKDNQRKQEAERQAILTKDNPAFILEETSVDLAAYQAHKLPLILDFGAEDCPPCQIMRPALETAHEKNLGRAVIKFFDVWKHPEAAGDYPISVIPTQVLFNADGTPYTPSPDVQRAGLNFDIYHKTGTEEHALTVHVGILTEEQFELILKDMGA